MPRLYVFWSDRTGDRTRQVCDDDFHAHSIAACLEDEWCTDDVDYDYVADEEEQS